MCSTCNRKNFEEVIIKNGDREVKRLEQSLGYGGLVIRCDPNGKNYNLAIRNEPKSDFRIYRCPTCGQEFFD